MVSLCLAIPEISFAFSKIIIFWSVLSPLLIVVTQHTNPNRPSHVYQTPLPNPDDTVAAPHPVYPATMQQKGSHQK